MIKLFNLSLSKEITNLTKQGNPIAIGWKQAKSDGKYLFNVKVMSTVFQARFIAALKEQLPKEMTRELINALYKHKWVVYAKRPFAGAKSAVEYLSRYTHKPDSYRIAISNHRIKSIENGKVNFVYKDYRHGSVKKEMALEAMEFIRRFSLHVLPKGFVRIRHYGICSSSAKDKSAVMIKAQMSAAAELCAPANKETLPAYNPKQCPCCKKETMQTVMCFNRRGPPADPMAIGWKQQAADMLACIAE